jgi:hypothetical protein
MERVLGSHGLCAIIIGFNCKEVPINPIIIYYSPRNPGNVTTFSRVCVTRDVVFVWILDLLTSYRP